MLELIDLSTRLSVEFADTTFKFRPLKYQERISLTIATVKAFQSMFSDVKAVAVKDKDGNEVMMNPYHQLAQNEIFGEQVDTLIASTLVETETEFREKFATDFNKPFSMSLMLEMMSDRIQREELRNSFVKIQKIDFVSLLEKLGNSDSTSDEQAIKDTTDVETADNDSTAASES